MTTTTELKPGQAVTYHGSMRRFHGEAIFRGVCDCRDCTDLLDTWSDHGAKGAPPMRYVLELPPFPAETGLACVRRESFTPTDVHFAQTA